MEKIKLKKEAFIELQLKLIEPMEEAEKILMSDIIDCMDMALSQSGEGADIDSGKTAKEAFRLIEKYAKEHNLACVGPFLATEKIIAPYLGVVYKRKSQQQSNMKLNFDDFI